jgi:thiol:disulfide interchange protein DsbD
MNPTITSNRLSLIACTAVVLGAGGFVPAATGAEAAGGPRAESDRIVFTATITPADPFSPLNQVTPPADAKFEVRRGETFVLTIRGAPKPTFHTYPFSRRTPNQAEAQLGTVKLEGPFTPLWPAFESPAEPKDEGPDVGVLLEHEKPFLWIQDVYVKPDAPSGQVVNLTVKIRSQQCSDKGGCVWQDFTLTIPVAVSSEAPLEPPADLAKRFQTTRPAAEVVAVPDRPSPGDRKALETEDEEETSGGAGTEGGGLLASILKALVGGFVSLLTPCVFPMIPITVSIFLKKAEAKQGNAVLQASVYMLTIVLVLTVAGVALLGVLVKVSQHWVTNLALGSVFIFFALSLLGMYEIVLPSGLAILTSSHERDSGMLGTVFQALTFSIVSFACVGPIFGGFIAIESTGHSAVVGWLYQVLPVLAFAVAFASPFFLLALFPSLIKSMPRSGSWMNSVKVVMGFLEIAAAVKFLRAAELRLTGKSEILTFDLALGIYVALALACGLYLLNLYRLPHDHDAPESIGVGRLLFSLTFLTLALYLLPGLFKNDDGRSQKPRGQVYEWVESFLLPDTTAEGTPSKRGKALPGPTRGAEGTDLVWMTNVEEAMARAAKENKPIFFDFTGLT